MSRLNAACDLFYKTAINSTKAIIKLAFTKQQFLHLMGVNGTFGIVSAYNNGNSKSQNKENYTRMVRLIQEAGLRYEQVNSKWSPNPLPPDQEGPPEKPIKDPSFLIRDASPEFIFQLAQSFNQDAVIYKDSTQNIIGMYYLKDNYALVAVKANGDVAAEMQLDKELYSKLRGFSFEFGFLWSQQIPWDGHTIVTKEQIKKLLKQ